MTPTTLEPLGDRAFLARFADGRSASAWAGAVRQRGWPGVVDVAAAHRSAAVFADPDRVDLDALGGWLRALDASSPGPGDGRLIRLPVLYDGEDLPEVARLVGRDAQEVAALHAGADYDVLAIGFLPGFPYAGDLPEPLAGLPRRQPPRTRVPGGSVAIAGSQTCVYPRPSPGGWWLLGRTPLRIADVAREHFPIRTGDRIRFVPVDVDGFEEARGRLLNADGPPPAAEPRGGRR